VRLPVQIAGGILVVVAIFVTPFATRPRYRVLKRVLGGGVLAYGVLFAFVFSGGALQPRRSPGALDNGAACAVLLGAAARLSEGDALDTTEVIFAFFAGEEVGAQGTRAFVDDHLTGLPARRTFMVNLDPVGASSDLTIVHGEGGLLRSFKPDRSVVALLDAAHRRVMGRPIAHTRGGGITDAFPFLARNIPAATIVSAVAPFVLPRGLHTRADVASRIDGDALDRTLDFVIDVVRAFDREPQQDAGHSSWPPNTPLKLTAAGFSRASG
jgi:Zn-dependent M28 family amino/carboxypeptidase